MSSPPSSSPIPEYALFDSNAVAIAALFGSPIAGTVLMAANYRRLKNDGSALAAILIGLAVTAAAVALGYLIPQGATAGAAIGLLMATRAAAKSMQGPAVEEHVRQGGKLGSRWVAFGVGLAGMALTFGSVLAVEAQRRGPKVTIGTKDEVYYSGSASKEEARALGAALKSSGYFSDKGASVFLSRGQGGTIVSFVVQEGAWDKPEMVSGFEEVGREIAPKVGGFPIKVRLINSDRDVKKELTVGKTIVGSNDDIYYLGAATEAEAKALGEALKTAHFFVGKGFTVLLAKGDGTSLSFVVKEGFWENPAGVADFERIVRQSAPAVGGLPVKLRLLNPGLEMKKELTVQ